MKYRKITGIITIIALLLGIIILLVDSWLAIAQEPEEIQEAPLNPEFLEYMQRASQPFYGYIPSTMDLSHLDNIPVQGERLQAAQPASWDWRDQGKVTPVKDQGSCGTCWIFGTTSVLESAVLLGDNLQYDFSEQSVALCVDRSLLSFYNAVDHPCQRGGNSIDASEVFIRKGAVLETCNPYNTTALNCGGDSICCGSCTCDSCTPVKVVDGYRFVTNDKSQIDLIKQAVSESPVTMAFRWNSSYLYLNDPTYGDIYDFYPCTQPANHLVSIIGWDDSVPHKAPGHSGTGAWLVKNSWSTGWGNDGYFWLAYDSSSLCEIAYLQYKDYNAGEVLYYWDEAGLVNSLGYGDTSAWMASVFTSSQNGYLTHVDFWTASHNASYEIYIYDGFFGSQLTSETGSCAEMGYYSIPLTSPVPLTGGEQFTVAVKMTTPGFNYPLPVECVIPQYYIEPTIQTGVSFARHTSSNSWTDMETYGVYGYNACLNARITTVLAVTSITPGSGKQGQTLDVIVEGTGFTSATTVNCGLDITINGFTVDSDTRISASITVDGMASPVANDVSVATPFGTGTLTAGFTVNLNTFVVDAAIYEDAGADSVVVIPVTISAVKDAVTKEPVSGVQISRYNASLTFNADFMEIAEIRGGDPPFDTIPAENVIIDNDAGTASVSYNVSPDGAVPPVAIFQIVAYLKGSTLDSGNLSVNVTDVDDVGERIDGVQDQPMALSMQRGDIQTPVDGDVDIIDAMFGAQYIVGVRPVEDIRQLNMASVKHDNDGDIKDITDCMFIAQYLVGIRDEYFESVP